MRKTTNQNQNKTNQSKKNIYKTREKYRKDKGRKWHFERMTSSGFRNQSKGDKRDNYFT